jgi:hypothetical protein
LLRGLVNLHPDNEHLRDVANLRIDLLQLVVGLQVHAERQVAFRGAKVLGVVGFKRHWQAGEKQP